MKRKLILVMCSMFILLFSNLVFANEINQRQISKGAIIDLGEMKFNSNYNSDSIIIRNVSSNKEEVVKKIIDKKTGDVIETIYCEQSPIFNKNSTFSLFRLRDSYDTTLFTVTREIEDKLATVQLKLRFVVYDNGSFRSINELKSKKVRLISSGSGVLKDSVVDTHPLGGSYPTDKVQYAVDTTIRIETSFTSGEELSVGFKLAELAEMGYSYNASETHSFYLRKPVSFSGTYSIY